MYSFKLKNSKIPIRSWIPKEKIEESALQQIENMSALPFAYKHIAIMPDVHMGYGVTIGGVLATQGVIIPNAIGVDIGCGMCTVKTSLKEIDKGTLKKIMGEIRKVIPVGFNKHKEPQDSMEFPKLMPDYKHLIGVNYIVFNELENARKQLGTLGGGNHFIEIQKGSDGFIWIMLHSGSRNLGYKVAKHYNELAYNLNKKWFSDTSLPGNKEDSLAFLPVESREGQDYLQEMKYCVDFAYRNRSLMLTRIIDIITEEIKDSIVLQDVINIAHNYASLENHFGENVWVHRKGATLARKDTIGIIPGSQGTKSYIVKGLGNPESFMSCSHGAGRRMSRSAAIKNLNLIDEIEKMDKQGIIHGLRNQKDLDEASSSYKDISEVMGNQKDLVEILV